MSKLENKKVHVSKLQIGMFVSALDRPWLETPFLLQGFMIECEDDIDVIAEYCEHVWIESARQKRDSVQANLEILSGKKPVSYINKLPAQDEHRKAIGVYKSSRRITKTILESIALRGMINTEEAKAVVDDCVQSVIRNPDALIWMSRVREMDDYTAEHSMNVCIYAISFGRHLGFDNQALQHLGLCGLLHDVGKMRVPIEVLNKPSKLTDKEFNMIKAHTVHGRNLLMSSPGMLPAAVDVAYSHHERMDGTGYPRKIKANGTSTFSRIIAIVDAYDAMTADRCYAPAIPTTDALNTIFKDRGTHFDEHLSIQFIRCIGIFPAGTLVELANGMVGIVLAKNLKYSRLPKLIIVLDAQKKKCKERILDLSKIHSGELSNDHLIKRALVDGTYDITLKEYQEKGLVFSR